MILTFMSLQSVFSARMASPALSRSADRRALRLLLCLLLQALAWPVLAGQDDKPEEESDWVEETINPKTEWVEEVFTPFNRWVERKIQGKPAKTEPPAVPPPDVFSHRVNPPANAISPQEAGRLLRLLYPGEILRIHFEPGPPPYYLIKLLGSKGNIASYYMHAIDGTLLDTIPPAADTVPARQNEAQGEQR
ncbi:hypothetical protein [Thalassolituus sp. UBA2009]|uniref:hypothetical protein n=1 Tax=Thalassolituus sp. UBA2009 TaxID=1947658 RepID=UPI00258106F2|nr:hypothetical protein [Thalassolituus sp. UBA2009]